MGFRSPWWLLLLLAVVAVLAAYVLVQRRREVHAVRFSTLELLASVAPKRPGWRRHLSAGVFALMLVALVFGSARPVVSVQVPRERATVMLAIDVSLSMEATDVKPTRIAAAKASAQEFVDKLPSGFNVGLVSFAGTANVVVPPTHSHQQVNAAISTLRLAESTATGDAVLASLQAIRSVPGGSTGKPPPARIVLISDGTRTAGATDQQAEDAATQAGVPVSTIAFGTQTGTVTINGGVIPVPVDRMALADLAQRTGGKPYTAESSVSLRQVYSDLGSSIGYRTEQRDISWWFLLGGIALALVAATLALLWTPRLP